MNESIKFLQDLIKDRTIITANFSRGYDDELVHADIILDWHIRLIIDLIPHN